MDGNDAAEVPVFEYNNERLEDGDRDGNKEELREDEYDERSWGLAIGVGRGGVGRADTEGEALAEEECDEEACVIVVVTAGEAVVAGAEGGGVEDDEELAADTELRK